MPAFSVFCRAQGSLYVAKGAAPGWAHIPGRRWSRWSRGKQNRKQKKIKSTEERRAKKEEQEEESDLWTSSVIMSGKRGGV